MRVRKHHAQRGLSLLLVGIMCLSMIQVTASGSENRHTHTFACYESWSLTCDQDHDHTEPCYTSSGSLSCGLEEGAVHIHNDGGYVCTQAATLLTCGQEVHTHGPECLPASGEPELEQQPGVPMTEGTDFLCSKTEHVHSDACYTQIYQCRPPQAEDNQLPPSNSEDSLLPAAEEPDPLSALRTAASSGGTQSLGANLSGTISEPIQVNGNFSLDLQGKTLEVTADSTTCNLFAVTTGSTFTIQDAVGGGSIHFKSGDNIVSVAASGTLNLKGGTLTSTGCNRAVFTQGTVNMTGGEISNNISRENGRGAGIMLSSAVFNMSGGKISGNTTTNNGGGICAAGSSTVAISGSAQITDNTAASGGGIYAAGSSTLTIGGEAVVIGNTSTASTDEKVKDIGGMEPIIQSTDCIVGGYQEPSPNNDELAQLIANGGGSVALGKDCTTKVSHTIAAGTSLTIDLNGHSITGALYDKSANLFNVEGTLTITGAGTVSLSGGDNIVSVAAGGTLNLQGGSFKTPDAQRAVFAKGTVNMSGGKISDNTTTGNGGGILLSGGTLDMSGGEISNNHAGKNGGGIAALYRTEGTDEIPSKVTISGDAKIRNNRAEGKNNADNTISDSYGSGGGIFAGLKSTVVIEGGEISGNHAMGNSISKISGGGGVYANKLTISGGKIFGNEAKGYGRNGKGKSEAKRS